MCPEIGSLFTLKTRMISQVDLTACLHCAITRLPPVCVRNFRVYTVLCEVIQEGAAARKTGKTDVSYPYDEGVVHDGSWLPAHIQNKSQPSSQVRARTYVRFEAVRSEHARKGPTHGVSKEDTVRSTTRYVLSRRRPPRLKMPASSTNHCTSAGKRERVSATHVNVLLLQYVHDVHTSMYTYLIVLRRTPLLSRMDRPGQDTPPPLFSRVQEAGKQKGR